MSKISSIISIVIFFFSVLTYSLTIQKDDYKLTIKKGEIVKDNKQIFWVIPTTLTNNSKDTLKYFSMSCSSQDFYCVDNKKLEIESEECDKNIPIILTLAPRQTKTVEIRLLINKAMNTSKIKFKIGLNLIKVSKNKIPIDFDFKEQQEKRNVIWSNLISI